MATYKQLQQHIRDHGGFVPKTCWIAHVMSDHNLTTRTAPNRADAKSRMYPGPPEKRAAILSALRHFSMI